MPIKFFRSEEARAKDISLGCPRAGDAGFDLPALEETAIPAGEAKLVRTGLHLAIPLGYVGIIRDRSGVATKGGATTAGVIDASYRGEVKVLMHNLSKAELKFQPGDRIAQIVVIEHLGGEDLSEVESLEALGETERGSGGFGSTGK